jgi:mannose-6-phosphate isomerase class I
VKLNDGEFGYACPAAEFRLSVIRPTPENAYVAPPARSVEILLCTSGQGWIDVEGKKMALAVQKGDSFLVPANLGGYAIQGDLVVYKAAVPLPGQ